jgi:5-methylcytosine-specific restriction endonuclease McrA
VVFFCWQQEGDDNYMKEFKYDDTTWRRNQSKFRKELKSKGDVTNKYIEELKAAASDCRYCGWVFTSYDGYTAPNGKTLDHVMPVSKGGTHTKDNLQVICWTCNALKSNLYEDLFLERHKSRIIAD